MASCVHEPTNAPKADASLAPVNSDSFIDEVLDVAHERAEEAVRLGRTATPASEPVIDLTEPAQPEQVQPRRDRRRSGATGYSGRERRREARREAKVATRPQVKVVDFVPSPGLAVAPARRPPMWRRLRRAWREWRIGRAPRHRHSLWQRLQYRRWRRQDRRQRRLAQGIAPGLSVPGGVFGAALGLVAVAAVVYLLVVAA